MQGKELIEIQGLCLKLAYLIQKNLDSYDDELEETYKDVTDNLFLLATLVTKRLDENSNITI